MDALHSVYEFGPFRLDSAQHLFLKQGQPLSLPPTAFDILVLLVERRGGLLSKTDLMNRVWPDTFVDENNLAQQISFLRKVLAEDPDAPHYIETVPRVGYRFIAETRVVADKCDAPSSGSGVSSLGQPQPAPTVTRRPVLYWTAGSLAAILLLLAVVHFQGRPEAGVSAARSQRIRSLVVLPLVNLSGDVSQDYFAEAMTDSLTTDLAQIHELRVISGTSATHYKGTHKTLPEIARELNVDGAVEGTVFRSGDRVRVTAQLIEALSDRHLWAHSYERDLRDVIRMQDEVARDIAAQIQVQLTPQERKRLASAPAVDSEAYQLFVQGEYFETKLTEDFLQKAIATLSQSIALDGQYAPAHVSLALAYETLATDGYAAPAVEYPKAEAELRKALELDENLAEAHSNLANVRRTFDWDWSGAETETQRALELDPNSADAHSEKAAIFMMAGHFDQAIAEIRQTQALDPVGINASLYLGQYYLWAGQYAQSIIEFRKTLELDPNFLPAHAELALAYTRSGVRTDAAAEYKKTRDLMASRQALILDQWMAPVEILLGKRAVALANLDWWSKQSARRHTDAYLLAAFCAEMGMKDRSLAWLEKAFEQRSPSLTYAKIDLNFPGDIRDDPRFQSVLRRMDFPD